MKKSTALLLCVVITTLFSCGRTPTADYNIVPLPQKTTMEKGSFEVTENTKIIYPDTNAALLRNAGFLAGYIKQMTGMDLKCESASEASPEGNIILRTGGQGNMEGYTINISADSMVIKGNSPAGNFYGIQTIRKSVPVIKTSSINFPCAEIIDAPRFSYRGMSLDVSRHFFSASEVKTYIDILALHDINTFHWHLTDDQGWRIEIKKYPKLTEIGSRRDETVIGNNTGRYDGKPYGGYYTQGEISDIVNYAADRYITIIPEIDMPGHMLAALASYPELGCTGGPYKVWTIWGVSKDVLCVGNPKALKFVEDVLTEVMKLFPSEYIHIGGDECPSDRWEKCPKCRALKRKIGGGDLQSYFTGKVELFLKEHGRKTIVWNEALNNKMDTTSMVMCWNNTEAGAKAAALHVKSIMTPTSYCYFDYYQTSETNGEPIAIGGYLPVKKVYSLEPVLPSIPENEKKYVYGVQANLWSEYIPTFSQVEYMVLPRMAALSEVQWCRSSSRNYDSFLRRIPRLVKIYDLYGYKYAKHIFGVKSDIKTDFSEGNVVVALNTIDNATIYYNINGGKAEKYDTPLTIKKSCEISAYAEREGKATDTISHKFLFSKSTTRPLTLKNKPYEEYTFGGGRTLVDGVVATCYNYSSGKWIGFYNTDLDATIELAPAGKKAPEISEVSVNNSISKASGVFDARALEIYVSADGKDFNKIYEKEYPQMKQDGNDRYIVTHKADFEKTNANYVRIIEKGERHMPDFITWGKGEPAFLFADEITVN